MSRERVEIYYDNTKPLSLWNVIVTNRTGICKMMFGDVITLLINVLVVATMLKSWGVF